MNILLIIAIILLVLWLLGFLIIPGLGFIIHVLLILAIIVFIIWLLRRVFKLF
jgi:hypothetical protein